MPILSRNLFLVCLAIFIFTFFSRNNCRSVYDIHPSVLNPPIQSWAVSTDKIEFSSNGYAYELTPLYDYEISALVVSKFNYRTFEIDKSKWVFPFDLCLVWGSNVESGIFRNRGIEFHQDCRWCWVQWTGDLSYNMDEQANTHLVINDKSLEKAAASLVVGDQVRIRGKLVNLRARLVGKGGTYDSREVIWNSSTTRTDQGAGACEVVYVEQLEVLKKANVVSRYLFLISMYASIALLIWNRILFFK